MFLALSTVSLTAFVASASETKSEAAKSTKYWVDTFDLATGYPSPTCIDEIASGCRPSGSLFAGRNYVLCKRWGAEVRSGKQYNHWWLLTDLDSVDPGKSRRAYVSAYYLSRWGNNQVRDNDGRIIPNC